MIDMVSLSFFFSLSLVLVFVFVLVFHWDHTKTETNKRPMFDTVEEVTSPATMKGGGKEDRETATVSTAMGTNEAWRKWTLFESTIHTRDKAESLASNPPGVWKLVLKRAATVASPKPQNGDKVIVRYMARLVGRGGGGTETGAPSTIDQQPPATEAGETAAVVTTMTRATTKVNEEAFDKTMSIQFRVGIGQVLAAWDCVVPTMAVGERALVWATHEYAFGELGCPPAIPERAEIVWEMEITEIESPNAGPDSGMAKEKRLQEAAKCRAIGNEQFHKGAFRKAIVTYNRGILFLNVGVSEDGSFGDEEKLALELNLAACHLKCKAWTRAAGCARAAIEIDPENAKAHFRLAAALGGMNEFGAAKEESLKAAKLAPQSAEIRAQIAEIQEKAAMAEKNDIFHGIFTDKKKMV